jgi:RHS repeat-associated protein
MSVTLPGTGGTLAFKYDGLRRRVQKALTQGSTTTITNYLYDVNNAVADLDQNGNVLARYVSTQNIDEPLAELRSSTISYYEQDGLGSVTSLTNSAAAIANNYTYDSFGNLTASSGSIANRFQYTAREFDSETGLYYYRARYSDPSVGRFLSEDAVRFRGGVDFYTYVKNRPTVMRDPTGRLAWGGGVGVSGFIGALWAGAAGEASCYLVGDLQGNTGLLCCLGLGGGALNGAGITGQANGIVCPTCKTICDMEGGFVQLEGFAGLGGQTSGGLGGSSGLNSGSGSFSGGIGVGAGGGLAVLGGSCKLIWKHPHCPSCSGSN